MITMNLFNPKKIDKIIRVMIDSSIIREHILIQMKKKLIITIN
jgi:hypothetical protein